MVLHIELGTGIQMKIFNKYFLLTFLTALILLFLNVINGKGTNGYNYVWGDEDNTHITKDGKIVIAPAIISISRIEYYLVGLKLKATPVICDNGKGLDTLLEDTRIYFILDMENDKKKEYLSEKRFNNELDNLGISKSVKLDYSRFDNVWNRYSKYYDNDKEYYHGCKPR